jgi:glutamate-1-semialdehyde 2,1-aminomutase
VKYCTELFESDLRIAQRRLADFVPTTIYDIHAHPYNAGFCGGKRLDFLDPLETLGCDEHRAAIQRYMPARRIDGLYFAIPSASLQRPAMNTWIVDHPAVVAGESHALFLATPTDDPQHVAERLRSGKFAGLKVYHVYAAGGNTMHARLEEYAPEWMWEILHEVRGVLMLHLVRPDAIADEQNQSDLVRLCRAYPNAQVILAHVGRSFNYRHAREGLRSIADLSNVVVDTSAICEADSFRVALDLLGVQRVLWGSDFPISETRGRCIATGSTFCWVHPEWIRPSPLTQMTLVGIESLLCLREACEDRNLTAPDVRALFRDNALRVLGTNRDARRVKAETR